MLAKGLRSGCRLLEGPSPSRSRTPEPLHSLKGRTADPNTGNYGSVLSAGFPPTLALRTPSVYNTNATIKWRKSLSLKRFPRNVPGNTLQVQWAKTRCSAWFGLGVPQLIDIDRATAGSHE